MRIREITEHDFIEIAHWFSGRKWPMPPIENVAPKWGLVAEGDHGELLACAYCYTTKSAIAFIDWTGTNPDLPDQETHAALKQVLEKLQKLCGEVKPKIRALALYTQSGPLAEKLGRLGFSKDEGYFRCLWSLKDSKQKSI